MRKSPVLGHLGLQETIVVASWYIWWQRREAVKGESVAPPATSAFRIHALTANYGVAKANVIPKVELWSKPPLGHYKLNVDASYFPSGMGAAAAIVRTIKEKRWQAVHDPWKI